MTKILLLRQSCLIYLVDAYAFVLMCNISFVGCKLNNTTFIYIVRVIIQLYVSGLDVLGQSPRHNICAFIELSCYLNCFIKIAYIMLNKYSDSDSILIAENMTNDFKSMFPICQLT